MPYKHNVGCVSSWAMTKAEIQGFGGCRQWDGGWVVSTEAPGAAGTRWGKRETEENLIETISVGVRQQTG